VDWVREIEQGLIGEKQVREKGLGCGEVGKKKRQRQPRSRADQRGEGGGDWRREKGRGGVRWHQSQQWETPARKWLLLLGVGPPSLAL
jgi:hypothetical protein